MYSVKGGKIDKSLKYWIRPASLTTDAKQDEISELYDNDKDSLVGFMFDNVSFDDAVKFYSRMSEEYVTIDKTNKKITVSGFYNKDKKILDKFFTMDWNNRTYSYTDMEGKNIVYDEKGYHEQ